MVDRSAGTQFGHIWLFRVIISLVLGISLWLPARTLGRRSFLQVTLAGLSVMELVSLAGVGHAAAGSNPFGAVHILGDALHLLTSAFWPGALAPLAAFLLLLLKSSQVEAIVLAAPVVRRFSAISLIAVAGMAFTGLLNSIFMVGSFRALLTSAYGQILVSKVILFCAMIGFGAWNLFLLKPRIAVELPTVNLAQKSAVRLLLRNILWEMLRPEKHINYMIIFIIFNVYVTIRRSKSRYLAFTEATAAEMVMPTTFLRALTTPMGCL
jgi:copper resistance protein D